MVTAPQSPARIGALRFSALGDLAACLPILRALHPTPVIVTSPLGHEVYRDEFTDFIILPDKSLRSVWRCARQIRSARFDCLIDLQNNDRSRLLGTFAACPQVCTNDGLDVYQPVTGMLRDIANLSGRLSALDETFTAKPREFIVLNAGSSLRWQSKRLPLAKWTQISQTLHARFGLPFVLTGGADERVYIEEVARALVGRHEIVAGTTTLPELKRLLARAWLTVSTDSGPMHLSAAMKTPTIGLFGPTNWVRSAPFGPWSVVLYDRTVYPDGQPPARSRSDSVAFFDHINLDDGLDRLAPYLA